MQFSQLSGLPVGPGTSVLTEHETFPFLSGKAQCRVSRNTRVFPLHPPPIICYLLTEVQCMVPGASEHFYCGLSSVHQLNAPISIPLPVGSIGLSYVIFPPGAPLALLSTRGMQSSFCRCMAASTRASHIFNYRCIFPKFPHMCNNTWVPKAWVSILPPNSQFFPMQSIYWLTWTFCTTVFAQFRFPFYHLTRVMGLNNRTTLAPSPQDV